MPAHYTRTRIDGADRFEITPMPYPMPARVAWVWWGGLALIVGGIPLLIFLVGALFIALGAWAMLSARKLRERYAHEAALRRPTTITLDAGHLATSTGTRVPLQEVAGIMATNDEPTGTEAPAYARTAGQAFQHVNARRIARAMHDASWKLQVRRSADSRPVTLVHGLDRQTAEALVSGLGAAIAG